MGVVKVLNSALDDWEEVLFLVRGQVGGAVARLLMGSHRASTNAHNVYYVKLDLSCFLVGPLSSILPGQSFTCRDSSNP